VPLGSDGIPLDSMVEKTVGMSENWDVHGFTDLFLGNFNI
jgi:hypothetical protein